MTQWKTVPVEPTPEMNRAGYMAQDKWLSQHCDNQRELHQSFSEPRWKAMLAAAPQREWVDLTDEEIGFLTGGKGWSHLETPALALFARAVITAFIKKQGE